MSIIKRIFSFLFISFFLVSLRLPDDHDVVYLTYTQDPSTSISVLWHAQLSQTESKLLYRLKGGSDWSEVQGRVIQLEKWDHSIHRFDLSNLESSRYYEFHIDNPSQVYLFRTLPSDLHEKDLKIAVGGDAFRSLPSFQKMNQVIAGEDPDFVVVGGDIAYTIGGKRVLFKKENWELKRWITFFSEWTKTMVGKDGRLIPIVPVVGNHDVPPKQVDPRTNAILFYELFAFSQDNIPYRTLDISNYLSLFLLDSGHSYPIEGDQTQWLESALLERRNVAYKFAAYHISAYPSVYKYNKDTSQKIRQYWSPLFEESGVQLAFEHHNHAYKRTFPIKNEKVDPNGVVYIGDGCWGVPARAPFNAWYLEKKMKQACMNFIHLSKDRWDVSVLGLNGILLDSMSGVGKLEK